MRGTLQQQTRLLQSPLPVSAEPAAHLLGSDKQALLVQPVLVADQGLGAPRAQQQQQAQPQRLPAGLGQVWAAGWQQVTGGRRAGDTACGGPSCVRQRAGWLPGCCPCMCSRRQQLHAAQQGAPLLPPVPGPLQQALEGLGGQDAEADAGAVQQALPDEGAHVEGDVAGRKEGRHLHGTVCEGMGLALSPGWRARPRSDLACCDVALWASTLQVEQRVLEVPLPAATGAAPCQARTIRPQATEKRHRERPSPSGELPSPQARRHSLCMTLPAQVRQ